MNFKRLFLVIIILLTSFASAVQYPIPDGTTGYDGTVTYPTTGFGTQTCLPENIIFKLSDPNNAHAAIFSEISDVYDTISCYPYDSGRELKTFRKSGLEDASNAVLRLSGDTNAHAEKKDLITNNYLNVAFGELVCRYVDSDNIAGTNECDDLDEVCVGAISSDTNAHVSDCASADSNGYQKICCQPRCRVWIDHTEANPTGGSKAIRAAFWSSMGGTTFAENAKLSDIVQIQIAGDGYCNDKEINFKVNYYNSNGVDEVVTLGNGEFSGGDIFNPQSNPSGNLISCAAGVCTARFNSENKITLFLNLIGNKFSTNKQYYFTFLMNGQNYFSNLLTIGETIITGCGNNFIEADAGEVCEPNILENRPTCKELGFDGGLDGVDTIVGCNQCRFDTTRCSCDQENPDCAPTGTCNDDPDLLNPGEECDDQSIINSGISCNIINPLWTGQLSCTDQCKFDVSKCGGYCGDGIREDESYNEDGTPRGPELCDKDDIPMTCQNLGYSGGTIGCSDSCGFDVKDCVCDPQSTTCRPCTGTSCGICGDDILDSSNNEQCDGSIPSGLNCKSISTAWSGELTCNEDCSLNIDNCVGTCLNGRLDDDEVCDPTAIGTPSNPNPRVSLCSELGFKEGYIKCTRQCKLDTSKCVCPDDDESCSNEEGSCGDDELNPGEECDDDSLTKAEKDKCNDFSPSWKGELSCNEDTCMIDFSDCEAISTRECKNCDDCNTFFGNCGYDECVNFCGLDKGGCYLDETLVDECTSCDEITKCEDYNSMEDCDTHRDEGLPGGRCIGYALNNAGQVADCKWTDGKCKENQACIWNCPDLDSVYGECQSDDFRHPLPGASARCTSSNLDCGANGVIFLPEKIKCGKYSEENVFPVFDNLNIILSILLLIGYYLIILKKREK